MERLKQKIEETGGHLIEFFETQSELKKMQLAKTASKIFSTASSILIIAFICCFAIVFISIAAAFILSELMGHLYSGFLVVAAFYVLTAILLFANRRRWMQTPLMNAMIKALYKNYDGD